MIKFTRPFKKKDLTTDAIERKALERLLSRSQEKARGELCPTCWDRRCYDGSQCNELNQRSNAYAWEVITRSAEVN